MPGSCSGWEYRPHDGHKASANQVLKEAFACVKCMYISECERAFLDPPRYAACMKSGGLLVAGHQPGKSLSADHRAPRSFAMSSRVEGSACRALKAYLRKRASSRIFTAVRGYNSILSKPRRP